MANTISVLTEVDGHRPIHPDPVLDAALNHFIIKFVDELEADIGESRATLAALEFMKEDLVDVISRTGRLWVTSSRRAKREAVLQQLGTKAEHLQAKKDYDAIHSHHNPHRP